MTPNLRRLVAASALLVLVLAACGGGGGGNGADATATEADAATGDATADGSDDEPDADAVADRERSDGDGTDGISDDPEALAQARAATLELDDLPGGWTMTSEEENDNPFGDSDDEEILESLCPDYKELMDAARVGVGDTADVNREFEAAGGAPTLQSNPTVFGDEQAAARAFELLFSREAEDCLATMFAEGMPPEMGAAVGDVEVAPLDIAAGESDQARGLSVQIPVTVQGLKGVMQLDLVLVQAGPIVHSIMAMSVGGLPELMGLVDTAIDKTVSAAAGD